MNDFARRVLIFLTLACAACVLLFHPLARANAPVGRYTVSGGTVTDTKTNLVWQQTPPTATATESAAATYCAGLGSSLGGTNWRLPTVKELLTLVDFTRDTVIDSTAFPNTPANYFWTATAVTGAPTSVWVVNFSNGETGTDFTVRSFVVRCVR